MAHVRVRSLSLLVFSSAVVFYTSLSQKRRSALDERSAVIGSSAMQRAGT
jgi:hypothetical protein